MKKYIKIISAFLAALTLVYTSATCACAENVDVSARSAILVEAVSGDVIFEKNAHEKLPIASTTKIMTAVVTLENADLGTKVKISPRACGIEGSSIYLEKDEVLTVEELLYATMLESANDAAAALAIHVAGSEDKFAELMNETAARIGMTESHFTNPHGLNDPEHYSTAADMAKLAVYALESEKFREIVSTVKRQIPLKGDEGIRVLINHNKLLRLSDEVIGVKTGFTKLSGRCLVSAAERGGVHVVAVTLSDPNDWKDHLAMLDTGLSAYSTYTLADCEQFTMNLPCVGTKDGFITVTNHDSLVITRKAGTTFSHVIEADRLVFPPVTTEEAIGRVVFYSGGDVVGEVSLYPVENVQPLPEEKSLGDKILDIFR
jgi:D-alanyl-D-alanine carboxypeptidase/D-alanyl-D-alanine carboxypeptidase (penicillin-binding protein 5/6)